MVININEVISKDVFDKLIQSFNTLKPEETLDIYFATEGGDVHYMEGIIDFVNKNSSRIRLFAYGEICSAGFDIFFRTKCYREILPATMGMAHFTGVMVSSLGTTHTRKVDDKAYLAWAKKSNEDCIKFYSSIGFTKKELERVKKGEDLWFQIDRLNEFLSKTNTIDGEHK
jgi:ATP-dependent protease ClpP protease subunit